jgi:hypothetical protein
MKLKPRIITTLGIRELLGGQRCTEEREEDAAEDRRVRWARVRRMEARPRVVTNSINYSQVRLRRMASVTGVLEGIEVGSGGEVDVFPGGEAVLEVFAAGSECLFAGVSAARGSACEAARAVRVDSGRKQTACEAARAVRVDSDRKQRERVPGDTRSSKGVGSVRVWAGTPMGSGRL